MVIKEKDATTRLRAAIKHESARSKWLSRVVIKQKKDASGENNSEQLSKDRADIVPVSFDGVEAPRVPTYLKLAPQVHPQCASLFLFLYAMSLLCF